MKLSNYLYLLASITIARAQDDNPSGHELQGHNHYDSLTMTTGTSSLDDSLTITTTSSLDDSLTTTTTSSLDDSAFRVSSVNKNVFEYSILLWDF